MDGRQEIYYGYHYTPSNRPSRLGHPRLDIWINEQPVERSFDPERVECSAVTAPDEISLLVVEHPWTLQEQLQVTAGRILFFDRYNKVHAAFTYGGELTIETNEQRTRCKFTSRAPILDLDLPNSAQCLLATQSEVFLAKRRAAWAHNPAGFDRRLASLEPEQLFCALVIALREKYRRLPPSADPETLRLIHYLNLECGAIQEHGQAFNDLSLEEIL